MCCLLLAHLSQELEQYRKDVLRFAWALLKSDNSVTRLWAYVCMARYIAASYQLPAKYVTQVFTSLLRMHGAEHKALVNKALDIVIPSLPRRLPAEPHRYSAWLKWSKKILTEEGGSLLLSIHVYAVIIRHARLFYPARLQFIPAMINSLSKIGLSSARSIEHRKLAVQMAELIVAWDKQARYEAGIAAAAADSKKQQVADTDMAVQAERPAVVASLKPSATPESGQAASSSPVPVPAGAAVEDQSPFKKQAVEPMAVDSAATAPAAAAAPDGASADAAPASSPPEAAGESAAVAAAPDAPSAVVAAPAPPPPNPWQSIDSTGSSPQLVELLLTFLFRLSLMTCDAAETRPLSKRCVRLVKDAMELWRETGAEVKLSCIDKIISNVPPGHDMILLHTAVFELLGCALSFQSAQYAAQTANVLFIDKVITACVNGKSMTPALREGIVDVLSLVSSHFPMAAVAPSAELSRMYKSLRDLVVAALKALDKVPSLFLHMSLLTAIDKSYPAFVVQNLPLIVKALVKLSRDVIARQQQLMQHHAAMLSHSRSVPPLTQDDKIKAMLTLDSLRRCLSLCYAHVGALQDGKKAFLTALTLIIEKSNDVGMLLELAKQIDAWMGNEAVLTPKEKCLLLLRMTSRERDRGYGEVMAQLFSTTLRLFRERKHDWLSRLQRVFMLGLRNDDASVRHQFQQLLNSSLQASLPDRLYYIFVTQDWEVMSDGYWISQCVQLLLSCVRGDAPLLPVHRRPLLPSFDYEWSDGSRRRDDVRTGQEGVRMNLRDALDAQQKKRSHSRAFGEGDADGKQREEKAEAKDSKDSKQEEEKDGSKAKPQSPSASLQPEPSRTAMLSTYSSWLRSYGNPRMTDLLDALHELSFLHVPVAHELFIRLFASGWSQLTPAQRTEIAPAVAALLSKPWHSRHELEGWSRTQERIHPMQTLLAAVQSAVPHIAVAPEVLRFAGKSFNGWHTALEMLEDRVNQPTLDSAFASLQLVSPTASSGSALVPASPAPSLQSAADALCLLYRDLNEEDLWFGSWRRRCSSEWSLAALAQCQFGHWQRAQDGLYASMQRHQNDALVDLPSHKHEQVMWESEWIGSARHLNQWEVLKDFSHHTGMVELQVDAAWRLGEWTQLKELIARYKDNEAVSSRLFPIYHLLHERKTSSEDVTKAIDQTIQSTVLREWQSLPQVIGLAHLPLLQRAQRLTELMESTTALDDVSKAARSQTGHNLKGLITTWRERLPNKWEDVTVWSDIMVWRAAMFNIIAQTYAAPADGGSSYRSNDSPWTIIKLAATARKQLLPTVCLTTLAKLFTQSAPALSTEDSFNKLREHIKCCLSSPSEMSAALNIISATNLDYFQPEQKAEMFRLKGEALQHLGYGDESNTAFSACLSICDNYGKGWLSWGSFCDRVFSLKKDIQWADHALVCFPAADTRVLTDCGFLFLSQIEQLTQRGCPPLFASYAEDRQQIDYVPGKLVFKQQPPERLVDFTQGATRALWDATGPAAASQPPPNHVSLRVTPDHDMYVQVGSRNAATRCFRPRVREGEELPYAKIRAEQLASGYQCLCDDSASCWHGRGSIRMLARAGGGVSHAGLTFSDAEPARRLGLQSAAQLDAFLQLYGFWLSGGSMSYKTPAGGLDALLLATVNEVDFLNSLLPAAGLREGEDWHRDCPQQKHSPTRFLITQPLWFHYFDSEYWVQYAHGRERRKAEATSARRAELQRAQLCQRRSWASSQPPGSGPGSWRDSASSRCACC